MTMNIKKHIPNAITLGNLACGCIAILLVMQCEFKYAAIMIILASVFDFFDGFAARMLHTKSDIGKELDSLCDMVSFGFAPAFIIYSFTLFTDMPLYEIYNININIIPAVCSIIYCCCVAIRLAKFNLDTRQTEQFLGLPSPAAAFVLISMPFWSISLNHPTLCIISIVVLLCIAMLCEYPLLSLKFHDFTIKNNILRYILLIIGLILVILLKFISIPIIIFIYIILSIIGNTINKHKTN